MKNFLLCTYLLLDLFNAIGQVPDSKTRIAYHESKECYFFNLTEINQTLYFDSAIYDNSRPMNVLIKNDTGDTVLIKIKSLQSDKQIFRENSTRYLIPEEYYSISPQFNTTRFGRQSSLLNSFFEFYYGTSSQEIDQYFIFRMRGELALDSLPDFKDSLNTNLPVAKTLAPSNSSTLVIRHPKNTADKTLPSETKPDSLGDFYFYSQNKREYIAPIDSFGTYKYHVYLKDLTKIGLDAQLLHSYLKSNDIKVSISKPSGSLLTGEENDFLILYCKSEDIKRIKTLLKGTAIHFMIDSRFHRSDTYLDDTYDLFFSSQLNWNETDVEEFLKTEGIKNYKRLRKTNNEFSKAYSFFVEITLDNKYQHSDQDLINRLIKMPEIAWISSGRTKYTILD